MIQLVDILCRCGRWLRRFRKRQGYGIHSPFAFNLVSGVIYESGEYYCYESLSKLRTNENAVLREKDDRLLFRLVNNFSPVNGVVISAHIGITENYLRNGCLLADWHFYNECQVDHLTELLSRLGKVDFFYIDDAIHTQQILKTVLPYVHDHTLIVVRHIHHNSALFAIWQQFIQTAEVRVTFDLYDFGLIYFEKRLNKEDYVINYF